MPQSLSYASRASANEHPRTMLSAKELTHVYGIFISLAGAICLVATGLLELTPQLIALGLLFLLAAVLSLLSPIASAALRLMACAIVWLTNAPPRLTQLWTARANPTLTTAASGAFLTCMAFLSIQAGFILVRSIFNVIRSHSDR